MITGIEISENLTAHLIDTTQAVDSLSLFPGFLHNCFNHIIANTNSFRESGGKKLLDALKPVTIRTELAKRNTFRPALAQGMLVMI